MCRAPYVAAVGALVLGTRAASAAQAVSYVPANHDKDVPDTHLVITFPGPPTRCEVMTGSEPARDEPRVIAACLKTTRTGTD